LKSRRTKVVPYECPQLFRIQLFLIFAYFDFTPPKCPTSSSLPGAVRGFYFNPIENMVKVTDCNELENLAEFSICISGTAPGGDEDIWAIKLYSGRMQIQK
jgi:hypothetical protein